MSTSPRKVLILCTGNSARSVLGEYLLRAKGHGRFETYSAGSHPTGRVNPLAIRTLKEKYNIDASGARSKSWDEFTGSGAPHINAKGLGPQRPQRLEYTAPSVDGEAGVVHDSEDLDEVPVVGPDASRAERRRAERAARKQKR